MNDPLETIMRLCLSLLVGCLVTIIAAFIGDIAAPSASLAVVLGVVLPIFGFSFVLVWWATA